MPIDFSNKSRYTRVDPKYLTHPPSSSNILPEVVKKYGPMVIRGAGGLSPGGPIGGLIGGGTEALAQGIEGKANPYAIAASAGLGAIPGGKHAKLLQAMLRGGGENILGTGIMQQTEGLHIPTNEEQKQMLLAGGIGTLTGGALHKIGKGVGKKIPIKEEIPVKKSVALLNERNPREIRGLLNERNPFQQGPAPELRQIPETATPEIKLAGSGLTPAARSRLSKPETPPTVDKFVEQLRPNPGESVTAFARRTNISLAKARKIALEQKGKIKPSKIIEEETVPISEANDWSSPNQQPRVDLPDEAQFHSSNPNEEIPHVNLNEANDTPTAEIPIDVNKARTYKSPKEAPPNVTVDDLGNPIVGGGRIPSPRQAGMDATEGLRGWFTKNITSKLPKDEKTGKIRWSEIINANKAIRASGDVSGALRQGIVLSRRKSWRDSIMPMVRALKNESNHNIEFAKVKAHPRYNQAVTGGVHFPDIEEAFGSTIAKKIPILGKYVIAPSERAYTTFLNSLRIKTFDEMMTSAEKLKAKDPTGFGDIPVANIANYINTASGRGNIGLTIGKGSEAGERAAEVLNMGLFSPRFIASRMQLLNPYTYYKLDPFTRKEAAKDMITMLGMIGSGLTLAKAAGAEVTANPTSADFGKVKQGNTRYDLTGGFGPYMRFFAQAIKGSATGEGGPDLTRFIRSKASPTFGLGSEMISGKDFFGQPQARWKPMVQNVVPMIASDVMEVMKNDPEQTLPAGLASIIGIPVSSYDTDKGSSGSKSKGTSARATRKRYKP